MELPSARLLDVPFLAPTSHSTPWHAWPGEHRARLDDRWLSLAFPGDVESLVPSRLSNVYGFCVQNQVLLFGHILGLLLSLLEVVLDNLLLLILLLLNAFLLDNHCSVICFEDLILKTFLEGFALEDVLTFLLGQLGNAFEHDLPLTFLLLLVLQADEFTLLDLIDDDHVTLLLLLLLDLLLLLIVLDLLQAIHLHHQILAFLLHLHLLIQSLLLLELLVTDGHTFSVHDHLIHCLHVIQLLIHDLGCLTIILYIVPSPTNCPSPPYPPSAALKGALASSFLPPSATFATSSL